MMNANKYKNFDFCIDERNIATITLDVPGRPVNILNEAVISELDAIVSEIENSDSVRLAIFQSGKESGFLAGADVNAIAEIGSATEAIQVIEIGQNLFQRIEWLTTPTIAIIHGPCMGGGLELALACDYRVARDNSSTKLALPEIKLGLIPGWGGTQRLPRQVGIRNAISMILTGKQVNATEACGMELVDVAITPDCWEHDLPLFIDKIYNGNAPATPRRNWRRLLEKTDLGRRFLLHMAGKSISKKQESYPALGAALRAIRASFGRGPEGFATERNEFVELLGSQTCRHLLDLFFARERARNLHTWTTIAGQPKSIAPIRRVGIVGAGAMGTGIGQLAALRGYDVTIREIDEPSAKAGSDRINQLIHDLATRKRWSTKKADRLRAKITINCDETLLDNCDLVIEAVVERQDVKDSVFANLDTRVKRSAILTTNTSSLSVSKMSEATSRKSQVAGLHFFNPVHRMELVEVVRGQATDDQTLHQLVGFVKALGKTPIVTTDTPGFLVNRVLFPYLGEAVRMVQEGMAPQHIDREIRRFGMPMGPLELLDQVGLDVAHHVANSLHPILPNVKPVLQFLEAMVERGDLGKKSSKGFYHYQHGKRGKPAVAANHETAPSWVKGLDPVTDGLTLLQRRLVYPMLIEAARCHSQAVVDEAWAIDMGMVLGTGFAPHRGGPLHLIDAIGSHNLLLNLRQLRNHLGPRFAPPKKLVVMSAMGSKFFGPEETPEKTPVTTE
jgi:3-hydroxyacyl-CoA dehydrogenase/enoyl-CoA hydratase/carnithine racemase